MRPFQPSLEQSIMWSSGSSVPFELFMRPVTEPRVALSSATAPMVAPRAKERKRETASVWLAVWASKLCSGSKHLEGQNPWGRGFSLPALPYSMNALAPYISAETLEHHYRKHHGSYVANLNRLTAGTELACKSLEELIMTQSDGPILKNAAQAWNHNFYWHSMAPGGGGEPTGPLRLKILRDFGSIAQFRATFNKIALEHFGSGWAWLVQNQAGRLEVIDTHDAGSPLREGLKPLLVVDLWEHAYCLDHCSSRETYIEAWWHLVNWKFAAKRLGFS